MGVARADEEVVASPFGQQYHGFSLLAATAEPASNNCSQAQAPKKAALAPPPGVNLPATFRPPPGLSLPARPPPAGLAAQVSKGLEDYFESASDCSTTVDVQEAFSSASLTPPLSPRPAAPVLSLDAMLPCPSPPPPARLVLDLAEAVDVPVVGTPECPSVGSVGHKLGLCKPCDFIHRNSCRIGAACKFCHLCEPLESRRRKKEKQRYVRTMRQIQTSAPTGWGA